MHRESGLQLTNRPAAGPPLQTQRPATFALARLSLQSASSPLPPPRSWDEPAELTSFLAQVAADPVVREAISVSSRGLAGVLDKVAEGTPVPAKRLRRAALSATRYVARMTYRSTPFGLMAGVAAVRFADPAQVRIGTVHRKHVRADMGRVLAVIRPWERDPAVLAHLRLVRNNLAFVRHDRLVLPYVLDDGDYGLPDGREQTVRDTRPVQLAMETARTPRGFGELVARVLGDFPGVTESVVVSMLTQLVESGFLLTDLRPPSTADDPIRHVLDVLAPIPDHPGRQALAGIERALANYASTPVGAGLARWRTATAAMDRLHTTDRAIQVDLAIDADLTLPVDVATELARAAEVGWRIAPVGQAPVDPLADYRAEFLSHYGKQTLVPVKELLDPQRGIGPPAGYLLPPGPAPISFRTKDNEHRDRALFAVAQLAAAHGEREVLLDDDLLDQLSRSGAEQDPMRPIQACAQLLAGSPERLLAGDFRPGAVRDELHRARRDVRPTAAGRAGPAASTRRVGRRAGTPRGASPTAQCSGGRKARQPHAGAASDRPPRRRGCFRRPQ